MKHCRIVMTGHGEGEVFIDGAKVEDVVACTFKSRVREPNTVTLELLAQTVEIEAGTETDRGERPSMVGVAWR